MGYISRAYIREKWNGAKWDMEKFLRVNDEEIPDKIPEEDVARCIDNIRDRFGIILTELEKYRE